MNIGPKYKICKRLGNGVFEKCQTQKFMLSEARSGKRRSGKKGRPRTLSDYGRQLLEKQKARFTYGISEKQLARYVKESTRGVAPTNALVQHLETRLDNVVYRLGFAPTRRSARQYVSHGHVTVNGKKMNIPSYHVVSGEKIGIRAGSKGKTLFANITERLAEHKAPAWMVFDMKTVEGEVTAMPMTENTETLFNISSVVEYYSR